MQIKHLKLTNAFQHSSLEVDFQPFQGIIGANGSGKSNLLEAMAFALTGVFSLPGKLESMVKEGEEKGKVELTVETEGDLVEIVAHLGKSNRTLSRPAKDFKTSKASEVLEYLERQVLRTPFPIVNSSSIIRQGQLDSGLFDTQAKRTEAFMRMAGLVDIEKKRQALADAKVQVTVPMLSFSVAETEKKIEELQGYLKKVKEERGAIPVYDQLKLESCQNLVAMKKSVDDANEGLRSVVEELKNLSQLKAEADRAAFSAQQSVAQLNILVASIQPEAEKAKVLLATAKQQERDWSRKLEAMDSMNKALADKSGLAAPVDYTGGDAGELSAIMGELAAKIATEVDTIKAFSQKLAVCPLCRRSCTEQEAAGILAQAKISHAELVAMHKEASMAVSEAKASRTKWEEATRAYQQRIKMLESAIAVAESTLKQLSDVSEPTADISYLQDKIASFSKASGQLAEAVSAQNDAMSVCAEVNAAVAAAKAKQTELSKQATVQVNGSITGYEEAVLYVREYQENTRKASELDGVVQGTERQLTDETKRLDRLRAEAEKAKTLTQYCDYLEFARTALHRDNFPSGKVKAFVDRMLLTANAYLDTMQAGFSVSYSHDTGFIAFFPRDNKYIRADRLSGGEKVTFALAFRFAVNDIHTDTGFVILDEPTVWLDDKHIDYVISALALVKTKIVPRVQIIIVTHDEKLAAVADSVFEVKKPS